MINFARISFQERITYTLGGFSLLIAILIGLSGHYINEKIEAQIWRTLLENEFIAYLASTEQYGEYTEKNGGNLQIFISDLDKLPNVNIPDYIQKLLPGIYDEIEIENKELGILVKDIGHERIFLVFNISNLERDEFNIEILVLALIIAALILIIVLSRIFGKYLVAPIKDIADEVSLLDPNERGLRIGDEYIDNELSVIALAINSYLEKIDSFIDREKEFIDTASHELRTPITIISGAVDILNAHPHANEVTTRAALRIKHATKDIAESINALFILAKNESQLANTKNIIHLDELIYKIIEEQVEILPEKKTIIHVELDKTCILSPVEAASIVFRNLVRNALEHSVHGHIDIILKKDIFEIRNQSGSTLPDDIALLFNKRVRGKNGTGNGMGLYLIKRICKCLGWELDTSEIKNNQFTIKMDLSSNYVSCDD